MRCSKGTNGASPCKDIPWHVAVEHDNFRKLFSNSDSNLCWFACMTIQPLHVLVNVPYTNVHNPYRDKQ